MGDSWLALLLMMVVVMGPGASPYGGGCHAFTVDEETMLRIEALTNYSTDVRPSATPEVTLMLHVTAISDVDITNEVFSLAGYWSLRWTDGRLIWTDYPNIPVVQYKPERIWTPVLVVSNSIDDLSAIDEETIPIRVERNGVATWNPPALVKVGCTMDVTYFPFDTQTCGIEVTSFGYTIQELDLDVFSTGLSFRYYNENGEWSLTNTSTERALYSEDGFQYARVTFFFTVDRKPLYYGLNMMLPVMICSALTLFVFVLPPESGEKIGFCLTVLLAFMVILTLVATDLPTTATNSSILEIYIAIVLIMGGLSVVFSIMCLNMFFKPEDKPVPAIVRKLTYVGMRICCHESCCYRRVTPRNESIRASKRKTVGTAHDSLQESAMTDFRAHQNSPASKYSTGTDDFNRVHDEPNKPRLIKRPTSYGFRNQKSVESEDELTWQTVAGVFDGVLFRFYALFLVVSSIVILLVLTSNRH